MPLKGSDPKLLYPAIRAIANNADGMARATLRGYFENNLTVEDVQALAPDILAAVKTPSPADKMFSNEIRMGGFKALTKYHFKEGIEAGVDFAKTQGGHGSESRTGEIMKEIVELRHGRPRGAAATQGVDRAVQRGIQERAVSPRTATSSGSTRSKRRSRPSRPPPPSRSCGASHRSNRGAGRHFPNSHG